MTLLWGSVTGKVLMAQPLRQIQYTYEDYLLFPEDGKRHELIAGDHFMSPSPITKHQKVLRQVFYKICNFLEHTPLGEVFCAPYDVVLSNTDIVEPDILFVSDERKAIITEKNIQGAPDLVIEILSESTRRTDEVKKRNLYERYGVAEYWIVDPELETVKIYKMTDEGYVRPDELSLERGDILITPLLPNFSIPLSEIFS
jgi:Uma2 family endonuclease